MELSSLTFLLFLMRFSGNIKSFNFDLTLTSIFFFSSRQMNDCEVFFLENSCLAYEMNAIFADFSVHKLIFSINSRDVRMNSNLIDRHEKENNGNIYLVVYSSIVNTNEFTSNNFLTLLKREFYIKGLPS